MPSAAYSRLAIECRGLIKQFGEGPTRVLALRGINLSIFRGELTLIVGPSGCGKTTLLSVMTGILEPTKGQVDVLGRDLVHMPSRERSFFRAHDIGIVFQEFNLLPALTATENVCLSLVVVGCPRRNALIKAREFLAELGMSQEAEKLPWQLSSGQQQRVAIARALLHQPHVLACDEPTSALDHRAGEGVMQLLRDAAVDRNRAVVVVTHDPRIFRFADRIATVEDGCVVKVEPAGG